MVVRSSSVWRGHRSRVIAIAVAVVAVGAVTGGVLFASYLHPAASRGPVVLLPELSYYTLPGGQFNAVTFTTQGPAVVNGTFTNTEGITLYQMTPAQVLSLSKTGSIGSYEWSSGRISNLTITYLNLAVPEGAWSIIFLNADNPGVYLHGAYTNTTIVTFYTPLVLTSP